MGPSPISDLIILILSGIVVIIWILYSLKLYKVTPDIIMWTNISFGFLVFEEVIRLILSIRLLMAIWYFFKLANSNLIPPMIPILIVIIPFVFLGLIMLIWSTFVHHLKKAQKEKLMDFS